MAHRGFFTFTGRLPEPDVVEQLVHMVVKSLFALFDAPDLDAVFHKPLNDERCFIITAADAVKHEYEQNIKLLCERFLLDLNQRVAILSLRFVTRNALFGNFVHQFPIRMLSDKLPACDALHGNIVMVNLPDG